MEKSVSNTPNGPLTDGMLGHSIDQMGSEAHRAVDFAASAVRPGLERVASGAHQAVDQVATAANAAADSLGATGRHWMNTQERWVEASTSYVRTNPVTAIAFAVGAGYLLNRLLSSR